MVSNSGEEGVRAHREAAWGYFKDDKLRGTGEEEFIQPRGEATVALVFPLLRPLRAWRNLITGGCRECQGQDCTDTMSTLTAASLGIAACGCL